MILDAQNIYSDAQAVTVSAVSTNIIDHGVRRNLGTGEPMVVLITLDVGTDFTTGNETYKAKLQTSVDAAFSSPIDVTPDYELVGLLPAGTKQVIPLVPDARILRFTRVYYTTGGTTPTATVSAELLPANFIDHGTDFYYPIAYTVAA